jgi:hypothetical protein
VLIQNEIKNNNLTEDKEANDLSIIEKNNLFENSNESYSNEMFFSIDRSNDKKLLNEIIHFEVENKNKKKFDLDFSGIQAQVFNIIFFCFYYTIVFII